MREAALETLIEDVRSNPERERVVDHLIAPAIRLRAFSAPNKRFALGQIADSAKGLSHEELAETLRRLTETRRQSVKQAHFEDAINATKDAALAKVGRTAERRNADPTMAAHTATLRERLLMRLGRAEFDSWFADFECDHFEKGQLTVSVADQFRRNWVATHYEIELKECAAAQFTALGRVEVVVRKEAARAAS
jgi:hypothetical protein